MPKALLYDATLCVNCKQCEAACADAHRLEFNDAVAAEPTTSDHKLTVVLARGETYMRRMCMHCQDPTCASVCPVAALRKTADGPVIYDEPRCMGCRYCMLACPFGVPKYEWTKVLPGVRKCDFCPDRTSTACAEVCPTGATKTGERDALIEEARARIRDNPGKYVDHVYGVNEVGGTSVLILSAVPFEEFGYRTNMIQQPLPLLTYRVLSRLPDIVALGGVALGGVWWITHRREEVAAAEGQQAAEGRRKAGKGDER